MPAGLTSPVMSGSTRSYGVIANDRLRSVMIALRAGQKAPPGDRRRAARLRGQPPCSLGGGRGRISRRLWIDLGLVRHPSLNRQRMTNVRQLFEDDPRLVAVQLHER